MVASLLEAADYAQLSLETKAKLLSTALHTHDVCVTRYIAKTTPESEHGKLVGLLPDNAHGVPFLLTRDVWYFLVVVAHVYSLADEVLMLLSKKWSLIDGEPAGVSYAAVAPATEVRRIVITCFGLIVRTDRDHRKGAVDSIRRVIDVWMEEMLRRRLHKPPERRNDDNFPKTVRVGCPAESRVVPILSFVMWDDTGTLLKMYFEWQWNCYFHFAATKDGTRIEPYILGHVMGAAQKCIAASVELQRRAMVDILFPIIMENAQKLIFLGVCRPEHLLPYEFVNALKQYVEGGFGQEARQLAEYMVQFKNGREHVLEATADYTGSLSKELYRKLLPLTPAEAFGILSVKKRRDSLIERLEVDRLVDVLAPALREDRPECGMHGQILFHIAEIYCEMETPMGRYGMAEMARIVQLDEFKRFVPDLVDAVDVTFDRLLVSTMNSLENSAVELLGDQELAQLQEARVIEQFKLLVDLPREDALKFKQRVMDSAADNEYEPLITALLLPPYDTPPPERWFTDTESMVGAFGRRVVEQTFAPDGAFVEARKREHGEMVGQAANEDTISEDTTDAEQKRPRKE